MVRRCVVQIYMELDLFVKRNRKVRKFTNKNTDDTVKASSFLAKKYAERTDADYYFLTDNPVININHPANENLQLFRKEWTEKYDQILYLDIDVFCWPEAPNIFDECPLNTFGISGNKHPDIQRGYYKMKKLYGVDAGKYINDQTKQVKGRYRHPLSIERMIKYCYVNTGVFVIGGQKVGDEMSRYLDSGIVKYRRDQATINYMMAASNVDIFQFDNRFNQYPKNDEKIDPYFTHAAGGKQTKEESYELSCSRAIELSNIS